MQLLFQKPLMVNELQKNRIAILLKYVFRTKNLEETMSEMAIKKSYSESEKAKIAVENLRGSLTFDEITKKYVVYSIQINRWKSCVCINYRCLYV
jgi:hypothetical protein